MSDADRIIQEARSWVGVPYHHQGRSRHGIDCMGLLFVVAKKLGYCDPDFDYVSYGREPVGKIDENFPDHLDPIPEPVPGCIVVLRWWRASHHVGIVGSTSDYPTLIHSLSKYGEVKEHRFGYWHNSRVVSCWKFRGPEL